MFMQLLKWESNVAWTRRTVVCEGGTEAEAGCKEKLMRGGRMLQRVDAGEAKGLVAWKAERLHGWVESETPRPGTKGLLLR